MEEDAREQPGLSAGTEQGEEQGGLGSHIAYNAISIAFFALTRKAYATRPGTRTLAPTVARRLATPREPPIQAGSRPTSTGSSKPGRRRNPSLGRFDSCAAPLETALLRLDPDAVCCERDRGASRLSCRVRSGWSTG